MASILTQTTPFILLATNMENRWPGLSGGSIVMVGDDDFFLDFGYNDTDEISMWPIVMDHALSHIYHHVFLTLLIFIIRNLEHKWTQWRALPFQVNF